MSKRLSGINPLSYMGVEPYTPPAMYQNGRAPTTTDSVGYNLGDFWLVVPPGYTGPESLWVLISLNMGIATWVQLYPGTGSSLEFETDSGTVNPVAGVVNVFGDGVGIRTTGAGNTITIHVDTDVAETYETDAGNAVPSSGVLRVLGGTNINTAGASNVVTINLDDTVHLNGDLGVDGNVAIGGTVQINSLTPGVVQATGAFGTLTSSKGTDGQVLIGSTAGDPAWANITSLGATVTITNGANSINLEAAGGSGGTIVSQFNSSDTWTKNASTKYVQVHGWNAGGGGASGAAGVANPAGGGAGGSYGYFSFEGPAFCFPASAPITVGAGGIGGASSGGGPGNIGGNGGITFFDTLTTMAANMVNIGSPSAPGSGGGANFSSSAPWQAGFLGSYIVEGMSLTDQLSTQTGTFTSNLQNNTNAPPPQLFGNGGFDTSFGFQGKNGRPGGTRSVFPCTTSATGVYQPATLYRMPTNGGGGAGQNSASPSAFSGGAGGGMFSPGLATGTPLIAGGTAGTVAGPQNGGNGNPGLSAATVGVMCGGTGGGGGSTQFGITAAGSGGDGGFPGGGGGGGGASAAGTSGAGGDGADGCVIVIEYL